MLCGLRLSFINKGTCNTIAKVSPFEDNGNYDRMYVIVRKSSR